MQLVSTELAGLYILEPERIEDERGYFARTFSEELFRAHGLQTRLVQTSVAFNRLAGTVRGLHYQRPPHAETKLVYCISGAVQDVVADLRPGSPTYLRTFSVMLSRASGLGLYIAEGLAHGYQSIEDDTELSYAMSAPHAPQSASGVRWNDPALHIRWPLPVTRISARDCEWPLIGSPESGLSAAGDGKR